MLLRDFVAPYVVQSDANTTESKLMLFVIFREVRIYFLLSARSAVIVGPLGSFSSHMVRLPVILEVVELSV